MSNQSSTIVQRLWNYCNVLRDDGVSYGDYVEQLTYLLFLKMDDEQVRVLGKPSAIPAGLDWASLLGAGRRRRWRPTTATSWPSWARAPGLIPIIFRKAQNKIQDPAKLRRLIELIDGETWIGLDMDVKGEIYEGLLEKNAQDTKTGAGQYFTPRAADQGHRGRDAPAARPDHLRPGLRHRRLPAGRPRLHRQSHSTLDRDQWQHLRPPGAARLGDRRQHRPPLRDEPLPARHRRRTAATARSASATAWPRDPGDRFDLVLTNPPFGKKSSVTFVTDEGEAQARVADHRRATTSGPPPATSSSTSSSTSRPSSRSTAGPPSSCPTTSSSRAAPARRCAASCCTSATSTPCCACPPASSTPRASRPTSSSSTASRPARQPWTETALDLRPAHQQGLHPQAEPAHARRPGRVRRLLQPREPPRAHAHLVGGEPAGPLASATPTTSCIARDKVNLDIFWLRDESLEDSANLPEPDVLAARDRRGPAGRAGAVRRDRRGPGCVNSCYL